MLVVYLYRFIVFWYAQILEHWAFPECIFHIHVLIHVYMHKYRTFSILYYEYYSKEFSQMIFHHFFMFRFITCFRYYANFSLHSYDSSCQRGSGFLSVIRHIQLYLNLSLNLQISNIAWNVKSPTNYRFSEVQVLHLLPNESDSTYCSQGSWNF